MKKNKKKNKKVLIIGSVILILGIIGIFVFNAFLENKSVKEVLKCSSTAKNQYTTIYGEQTIEYIVNEFKNVELDYRFVFTNEKVLPLIETMKYSLKEGYIKFEKLESFEYKIDTIDNELILNISVNSSDYFEFERLSKESGEGLTNFDNLYADKNRFISYITNLGGECVYE